MDQTEGLLLINVDGVGSKIEVAERLERYDTIPQDLAAMLIDDATRRGAAPIAIIANLDTRDYNVSELLEQSSAGLGVAASAAGIEHFHIRPNHLGEWVDGYGENPYNLNGAVLSYLNPPELITGMSVHPEDPILLLRETSPGSNGMRLMSSILRQKYGRLWHERRFGSSTLGEALLEPCTIYGSYSGKAIAHITGGGLPEKIGRMLAQKQWGSSINPFDPPEIFRKVQEDGRISDREAYEFLHMGQRLAIVPRDLEETLQEAERKGHTAKVAGYILPTSKLSVTNRGAFADSGPKQLYWSTTEMS